MTNFKIPKKGNIMMPFNFGPRDNDVRNSGWYRDVSMLIVPYKTDADILRKIIPEHFKISDEPTISVNYACNKDIDWLAGRNYNLISVSVEAIFSGDVDEVAASYNLVMWENLTDPILTGRELQGIPKIYADIDDISYGSNSANVRMSHFNNPILDIAISNTVHLDKKIVDEVVKEKSDMKSFGYRYIPNIDPTLPPVVTEPILHNSKNLFTEMSLGKGLVKWHSSDWEQNPTQSHIINILKALPILEYEDAVMTKGATNLFIPDKPSKVLR
jgi:acetoacetate decarboxylase